MSTEPRQRASNDNTTPSMSALAQIIQNQPALVDVGLDGTQASYIEDFVLSRMGSTMTPHQRIGATFDLMESQAKSNIEAQTKGRAPELAPSKTRDVAAAFEQSAKSYYDSNPALQNYMTEPLLPKSITPLEDRLITEALKDQSIGVRQSVFAVLKENASRQPNMTLDDTISSIDSALIGYENIFDEVSSNNNSANTGLNTLFKRRLSDLSSSEPDFVAAYQQSPEGTQRLRNAVVERGGNPPYPDSHNPAILRANAEAVQAPTRPPVNQGSTMSAEPNEDNIDPLGFDVSDEEQEALNAALNNDDTNEDLAALEVQEAEAAFEAAIMNDTTQQANPNEVRGNNMPQTPVSNQYPQDLPEIDTTNMPPPNEFPYSDDAGMEEMNRDYDIDDFDQAPQPATATATATAAESISEAASNRSYVDTLNAQIEKNAFYANPAIDKFEIEDRLVSANTTLDELNVSDAMRVGILHQELASITNDIRDGLLSKEGLTVEEKDTITADANEGLNIASRQQLNDDEKLNDFSEASNAPYAHQGLNTDEQSVLDKSTRDIPQGARQYAFSQLADAQKGSDKLSFKDTLDSIRQSLSDFDQTYKQVNPSAASEYDKFNKLVDSITNEHNAKNTNQVSNPAASATSTTAPTPAATNTAPNPATTSQTTNPTTAPNPSPSASTDPTLVDPAASTKNQQSQDQEIPEPTTPTPQVGGGGTSYSLFGGFNDSSSQPPAATPAQNKPDAQEQPLTNDAPANNNPFKFSAEQQIVMERETNRRIAERNALENSTGEQVPPTDVPDTQNTDKSAEDMVKGANAAWRRKLELDAGKTNNDLEQQADLNSDNVQSNETSALVDQEQSANEQIDNDAKVERQENEQSAQEARLASQAQDQKPAVEGSPSIAPTPQIPSDQPVPPASEGDVVAADDVELVSSDEPDTGNTKEGSDKYDGLTDDQIIAKEIADALAAQLSNARQSAEATEINEVNQADQNISPEQAAGIADDLAENNAKTSQDASEVATNSAEVAPDDAPAPTSTDDNTPTSEAAPAPKPAPKRFSDRFADDINQGLRDHHELLMQKYADDSITDEELYSETEKFLENYETLNERAATLAQENHGKNLLLEQYQKGLEETAKLKDDIYQKAESKNLLNPDHPLNIEAAKHAESSEKKNGLADKFNSMGEAAEKAMQAVTNAMTNVATAVAGMFGGKKQ